jgi:hypothetical protein
MAIGFSDGTSYEDMHDYYLGQPHSKLQAPDRTTDEEADPFHNKIEYRKVLTPLGYPTMTHRSPLVSLKSTGHTTYL